MEIKNIKLVDGKVQYEKEEIIEMSEEQVDAKMQIIKDRIKALNKQKAQLQLYKDVF